MGLTISREETIPTVPSLVCSPGLCLLRQILALNPDSCPPNPTPHSVCISAAQSQDVAMQAPEGNPKVSTGILGTSGSSTENSWEVILLLNKHQISHYIPCCPGMLGLLSQDPRPPLQGPACSSITWVGVAWPQGALSLPRKAQHRHQRGFREQKHQERRACWLP